MCDVYLIHKTISISKVSYNTNMFLKMTIIKVKYNFILRNIFGHTHTQIHNILVIIYSYISHYGFHYFDNTPLFFSVKCSYGLHFNTKYYL